MITEVVFLYLLVEKKVQREKFIHLEHLMITAISIKVTKVLFVFFFSFAN